MSDRIKILFIIFIALGIYYPSIFGEENTVDDVRMITNLLNIDRVDLKSIFLPGSSIYYYRPVLWLSFLMDRFLFGCSASIMHFENVLIHTICGVFVFLITREIIKLFKLEDDKKIIPFFTSLIFIVHPVNTEAVNWISGRTDLLAGLFVFISFYVFLKKGINSFFWSTVASVFYLFSLFSKESGIGLLLVLVFLIFLKDYPLNELKLLNRVTYTLPFFIIILIYFFLRMSGSNFTDAGISTLASVSKEPSFLIPLSGAIKAFGFYTKKLFIPVPLNFGIIEINRTLYFWFGLIICMLVIYISIFKRGLKTFLIFFSIFFFLPAIPVAITKMAWTPLAERYLYISSFGISALFVLNLNSIFIKKDIPILIFSILLITTSVITVKRNIVWQSNLTLYEDTIKKSPNFAPARNEYAIALYKKGRIEEARKQFEIAERLAGSVKYVYLPRMNLEKIKDVSQSSEILKERYLNILKECNDSQIKKWIISEIIKVNEDILKGEKDEKRKKVLYKDIIDNYKKLIDIENNGFYYYRMGQYYIALGDKEDALISFREAVKLSPDQFFSEPARKLIKRLENKG